MRGLNGLSGNSFSVYVTVGETQSETGVQAVSVIRESEGVGWPKLN